MRQRANIPWNFQISGILNRFCPSNSFHQQCMSTLGQFHLKCQVKMDPNYTLQSFVTPPWHNAISCDTPTHCNLVSGSPTPPPRTFYWNSPHHIYTYIQDEIMRSINGPEPIGPLPLLDIAWHCTVLCCLIPHCTTAHCTYQIGGHRCLLRYTWFSGRNVCTSFPYLR